MTLRFRLAPLAFHLVSPAAYHLRRIFNNAYCFAGNVHCGLNSGQSPGYPARPAEAFKMRDFARIFRESINGADLYPPAASGSGDGRENPAPGRPRAAEIATVRE